MSIFFTIIFLLFNFLVVNKSFAIELKDIDTKLYLLQNPSPERQKIVDFIVQQFDDKQNLKITQKLLDQIWKYKDNRELEMVRIQIVDQKLYFDSHDSANLRSKLLKDNFKRLLKHYKISNIDFIIYAHDFIYPDSNLPKEILEFPAFMMSKNLESPYEKNKLLIPDIYMTSTAWRDLIKKISEANNKNPWNSKVEKVFWRGASNDHYNNSIKNFSKLDRLKLVMLSKLYPNLIDAQFSKYVQFSKDLDSANLRTVLNILWGNNPKSTEEVDHLKYKYLISIDGNSCAWIRVPWIMLSNSVLVKQETFKIEWFYPAIEPYVHYVPVNTKLTNIFQQIDWMKAHDGELQQISQNSRNFVENNLMPDDLDAHTLIILNEYSKLHHGEKITPTLPILEEEVSLWALLKRFFS